MNFPIRKYYKGHVDNGLLLSFKTIRCLFFNLNIFLTAKNKTETKNEISQFLYHHHYYYILFWAIWSQQSLGKYLLLCLSLCLHYLKKNILNYIYQEGIWKEHLTLFAFRVLYNCIILVQHPQTIQSSSVFQCSEL